MKSIVKPLLLSSALLCAGVTFAQTPASPGGMMHAASMHHGRMDPQRMQQRVSAHLAELKAKLGLNGAQEDAWAQYSAAMQAPADMAPRMGRENRQQMRGEWQALTTPQRIARMNEMRAQRDARLGKRNDATLAFYNTLSAQQQQVFDANTMGGHDRRGHGATQKKQG